MSKEHIGKEEKKLKEKYKITGESAYLINLHLKYILGKDNVEETLDNALSIFKRADKEEIEEIINDYYFNNITDSYNFYILIKELDYRLNLGLKVFKVEEALEKGLGKAYMEFFDLFFRYINGMEQCENCGKFVNEKFLKYKGETLKCLECLMDE